MDPSYPKTHPVEQTIEECSELIQALQKAKRFGWDAYKPGHTRTNRIHVIMEIRDVEDALVSLKAFVERQPCTNTLSSPTTSNQESNL
jgi:hypothetical protein